MDPNRHKLRTEIKYHQLLMVADHHQARASPLSPTSALRKASTAAPTHLLRDMVNSPLPMAYSHSLLATTNTSPRVSKTNTLLHPARHHTSILPVLYMSSTEAFLPHPYRTINYHQINKISTLLPMVYNIHPHSLPAHKVLLPMAEVHLNLGHTKCILLPRNHTRRHRVANNTLVHPTVGPVEVTDKGLDQDMVLRRRDMDRLHHRSSKRTGRVVDLVDHTTRTGRLLHQVGGDRGF
jgi:hypothetical protein